MRLKWSIHINWSTRGGGWPQSSLVPPPAGTTTCDPFSASAKTRASSSRFSGAFTSAGSTPSIGTFRIRNHRPRALPVGLNLKFKFEISDFQWLYRMKIVTFAPDLIRDGDLAAGFARGEHFAGVAESFRIKHRA